MKSPGCCSLQADLQADFRTRNNFVAHVMAKSISIAKQPRGIGLRRAAKRCGLEPRLF
jgi:hypothetical protein